MFVVFLFEFDDLPLIINHSHHHPSIYFHTFQSYFIFDVQIHISAMHFFSLSCRLSPLHYHSLRRSLSLFSGQRISSSYILFSFPPSTAAHLLSYIFLISSSFFYRLIYTFFFLHLPPFPLLSTLSHFCFIHHSLHALRTNII